MKNREKQKRSWYKIKFVTKPRGGGVTRLGIPEGYVDAPIQGIRNFLQDPNVKPAWVRML